MPVVSELHIVFITRQVLSIICGISSEKTKISQKMHQKIPLDFPTAAYSPEFMFC